MADKKNTGESSSINRRVALKLMTLALGGMITIPLILSPLRKLTTKQAKLPKLPGEGSIFQPKRDLRLDRWEQTNQ